MFFDGPSNSAMQILRANAAKGSDAHLGQEIAQSA
jgi:hypothetical protein